MRRSYFRSTKSAFTFYNNILSQQSSNMEFWFCSECAPGIHLKTKQQPAANWGIWYPENATEPGLESRCFSVKHAGAPSIGLYFAEKIMSAFEQILSNTKYFHHLIICQILFLTKIRGKKFTCNSILIVDSEIQLLFLWDWTSSEHRDSTLGTNPNTYAYSMLLCFCHS